MKKYLYKDPSQNTLDYGAPHKPNDHKFQDNFKCVPTIRALPL